MRAIKGGADTSITVPQLNGLGAKKRALETRLETANNPDLVELHPQAAMRYAAEVAKIHSVLAVDGHEAGLDALAIVRELVRRIVLTPDAARRAGRY